MADSAAGQHQESGKCFLLRRDGGDFFHDSLCTSNPQWPLRTTYRLASIHEGFLLPGPLRWLP